MATYYFDFSAPTNGTGTEGSPYNTFVGFVPADNDVMLLKRGTTYYGSIEEANLNANNLTVSAYGTGENPILTSLVLPTWTQIGDFVSTTLASNTGGVVCENGAPLNCVLWSTSFAVTSRNMTPGSYTYDYNTNTYYAYPASPINAKALTVSTLLYGVYSLQPYSGLTITNITFLGFSRHGIQFFNRSNLVVYNNVFKIIGGHSYLSGIPVGNGIECSAGCSGGRIYENTFQHIFDSPITTQIYTNSVTVENYEIYNNIIYDCGLYGIELTVVGAGITNATLRNIYVHDNLIMNAGYNYRAKNVTGRGILVGGNQATTTMVGIRVYNNILKDNRWGLTDQVSATADVVFSNNLVESTRGLVNARGIYTSGAAQYIGNKIIGYFYAVGSYGNTSTRVGKIYNNTLVDCEEAFQQDTSVGTLEIKNNVIWPRSRLVRIAVAGLTTVFQYNCWRSGITNGGITVDGTSTQVSAFPLNTTYDIPEGSPLKWSGTYLNRPEYHNLPSRGAIEFIPKRGIR